MTLLLGLPQSNCHIFSLPDSSFLSEYNKLRMASDYCRSILNPVLIGTSPGAILLRSPLPCSVLQRHCVLPPLLLTVKGGREFLS